MFIKKLAGFFRRNREPAKADPSFTLVELLVVIFIVCFLTAGSFIAVKRAKERAYLTAAKTELILLSTYVKKYYDEYGDFPADVNRGLPPGIEKYFEGRWPKPIWPGSVYDWDNWTLGDGTKIYQISIRFCPLNDPNHCRFPYEPWAEDFDYYSSVYYCLFGPCRAHQSVPADHPGYQIN